ncbi:MAG: NRDE family protein [Fidelibacterota bacterium]|nr:MAG: NRDE family protein [Candidatus Neomarinimicrobiota bacterium]
MCTLLFRFSPNDQYPLAILSNRDEAYKRPSGGWAWRGGNRRYFAPVDLEAGGTWIGLNESGVVAALTNIFPRLRGSSFRSRGALVIDLLHLDAANLSWDVLPEAVSNHQYNKFNLLVADRSVAYLFTWRGRNLVQRDLTPGVYEVANRPFRGRSIPDDVAEGNEGWLAMKASRLVEHPFVCKHGRGYGTCSSHKLLVHGTDRSKSLVWHLDGHPCESRYKLVMGTE